MFESSTPKISVILPVYNAEKYLFKAIDSILNQTFSDFELIVLDDGSSDTSLEIINSFTDERIKLIKNEKNLGLIATLNKGILLSKSEFIARMDADDICLPQRFEVQYKTLVENPDVGLVGSSAELIDENDESLGPFKVPENHDEIVMGMLFTNQIIHPTVMLRRSILADFQPSVFDSNFLHCEDYELWLRILKITKVKNIQESLLKYRINSTSISQVHSSHQFDTSEKLKASLAKTLEVSPSLKEIRNLISLDFEKSSFKIMNEEIFQRLNYKFFSSDFISHIYWNVAMQYRKRGEPTWKYYLNSSYKKSLTKTLLLLLCPILIKLPKKLFKTRLRVLQD